MSLILAFLQASVTAPGKDVWDKTLVVATIALVIVGIWGIRVAVRTVKAVEKQTELQTLGFTQWVDVKLWKREISSDRRFLFMKFSVVNPTDWPLTVISVRTVVRDTSGQVERTSKTDPVEEVIAPHEAYPIVVKISLNDLDQRLLMTGRLRFRVTINVSYADLRKKNNEQGFAGLYSCSIGDEEANFSPLSILEEINVEEERQYGPRSRTTGPANPIT